jgi:hypothetical protein
MEENAYITSIIAGAIFLIASVRLLRLNRRTGERPELLLGLYFGLSGVYYLGYNAPNLLGLDSWPPAISLTIEWFYTLGVLPYLFFIRAVFRPNQVWAGALLGFCSTFLLVGTLVAGASFSLDDPWFLVQWVGYTTPGVWLCCEALLSRRGAQKRARIGICPPIVANRYLLLALFGGFQFLACVADLSYAADITSGQTVSLFSDALVGGSEIASVAILWLAFFPPSFYSNWIARRAVIPPTPMDE